jgi:hypothetical protein
MDTADDGGGGSICAPYCRYSNVVIVIVIVVVVVDIIIIQVSLLPTLQVLSTILFHSRTNVNKKYPTLT